MLTTFVAHFHFARYLDSLFQSSVDSDDRVEHLIQAIDHYGAALNLGVKHLFQSLPRLLTMWLEFTSLGNKDAKSSCHDGEYLRRELINLTPPDAPILFSMSTGESRSSQHYDEKFRIQYSCSYVLHSFASTCIQCSPSRCRK